MNSACLDLSFLVDPAICFPEDSMADAVEAQVASTLPVIAGLVSGLTDTQRLLVLVSTVENERLGFIEMYGDPFGADGYCVHDASVKSAVTLTAY